MNPVHTLRLLSKVARRHSLATLQGFTVIGLRHSTYSDGLPLSQLAKEAGISSQQSVSYIVRTLGPQGLGLILRQVDDEDRRSARLYLSTKGERLWKDMTVRPVGRPRKAQAKGTR